MTRPAPAQEYLAVNPMGQVPALAVARRHRDHRIRGHDGASLRRRAGGRLLPPLGATPAPRLSMALLACRRLYEADLRYYYPDRYTTEPSGVTAVQAAAMARMDRWPPSPRICWRPVVTCWAAALRGRPLSVHAAAVASGSHRDPHPVPGARPVMRLVRQPARRGADLGAEFPRGGERRVVDLDRLERALIQAARERRTVTYGQLLALFRPEGDPITVAALCRDLGRVEARRAGRVGPTRLSGRPQSDGLPGEGYFDQPAAGRRLCRAQRRAGGRGLRARPAAGGLRLGGGRGRPRRAAGPEVPV